MKSTTLPRAHFRDLRPLGEKPTTWNHMVPRGEFPGTIDLPAGYDVPGYGLVEEAMSVDGITVLGDEQLESIVHGFQPEMLIDPDHLSHDMSHNTEAMGWGQGIRFMENRADGLEVETEWTELGKEKILKKIYRYISPEFDGRVRYEDGVFKFFPTALTGAGLTNRPKLKALKPVSANRENHDPKTHMKAALTLLCGLIGAPETATEQELTSKVETFKRDMATQKNRAAKAEELEVENKKLKDEAISSDLERFSDVIEDKDSAKTLLQTNREATVKLFAAAQKKKAGETQDGTPQPVYQRNRATPPDGRKVLAQTEEEQKASAHFRAVSGRATQLSNEARTAGKPRDWNSCWEQAEGELASKQ